MAATQSQVTFRDVRCGCHRLLLRVSSTSSARFEVKCSRCAKLAVYQSSTGA